MNFGSTQVAYTNILKHIIETGHSPHYTDLAIIMGISPDEARDLQRQAAMADPAGGCWMSHDTDYIEAWSPFSNLPTHHRISVDGEQKWFGV